VHGELALRLVLIDRGVGVEVGVVDGKEFHAFGRVPLEGMPSEVR
jgi:hypothetical protein